MFNAAVAILVLLSMLAVQSMAQPNPRSRPMPRTAPLPPPRPADLKPPEVKEEAEEEEEEKEEEEEPSVPEDEVGEGDPYLRYEKSSLKDQNCDPTILENFYKKSTFLSCLSTGSGYCLQPGKDELSWGLYGAGAGAVGAIGSGLAQRRAARIEVLRYLDNAARLNAVATSEAVAGKTAAQLARAAKPLFLMESEAVAARTLGGIVVRGGSRGALYGFLGGTAMGVGFLVADLAMTYGISTTGCSERDETDPNFRKYVPLEKGTCHTPVYTVGAPQVREFMKLPLKEKLKILDSNRRICGFYRSMNEEMDKRIAQLEGGSAVGSVTCDATSGDINFTIRDNKTSRFTIKRKPGTKEMTAFQFRDHMGPNLITNAADFDLVKTEFGSELSKIHHLTGFAGTKRTIPYESFPRYDREEPGKARVLIHAFRNTRKHAPQLIACCDKSPADLAKPEGRIACPPEWFGKGSPAQGSSTSTR